MRYLVDHELEALRRPAPRDQVGGRNKVWMADLRAAFTDDGFPEVATYIQSGNVLFTSNGPRADLEDDIESMLERRFGTRWVTVVRTHRELERIVDDSASRPCRSCGCKV